MNSGASLSHSLNDSGIEISQEVHEPSPNVHNWAGNVYTPGHRIPGPNSQLDIPSHTITDGDEFRNVTSIPTFEYPPDLELFPESTYMGTTAPLPLRQPTPSGQSQHLEVPPRGRRRKSTSLVELDGESHVRQSPITTRVACRVCHKTLKDENGLR